MHTFRVWAPEAESVTVRVAGKDHQMQEKRGGWWEFHTAHAGNGTRYGFLLNGEDQLLPDPRSPFQPEGVNGPSEVVEHSLYKWSDAEFVPTPWQKAVIYELHVGTFSPEGNCDGVIAKLDYLRELGITHIELLPFAEFPGRHGWGYDGVDLFAPHAAYGGPDGLKRLVDAAHGKGLAVIMDVVYNHFGPAGNYVGKFGPYFTELHKTPWGDAVNLEDAGAYEVRRFFCDNALMWLRDYHLDGLRLDAVHAYMDRSAINFMEQINAEVSKLCEETGKDYLMIAESDLNDPRLVSKQDQSGYGFQAQWSDDFHHALVALLTGDRSGYYADFGTMTELAKALQKAFVYDGEYSHFRKRVHGKAIGNLPGRHFVGYSQNHDQVGNRAKGERLVHLAGVPKAKIAAALVLLGPFLPMLFQGEEWAASTPFQYFTDHEDKELGRLVSEGRKKEFAAFGWDPEEIPDPQSEETFRDSLLKWEEIGEAPHAEMLEWYRRLIALRRERPDLSDGDFSTVSVTFDDAQGWLVLQHGSVVVVCSFSEKGYAADSDPGVQLLLGSDPGVAVQDGRVSLPGIGVAVLGVTVP